MVMHNTHEPTKESRQRVIDLCVAGIPKELIAQILKIHPQTLNKHYELEMLTAKAEKVTQISNAVTRQAQEGDPKAQALYLKTHGAQFGWVEKQVVENVNNEETQALKDKLKELEGVHEKDF